MDLFTYEGMSYLAVANLDSGYYFCEPLGKKTSSKQVSDIVRKIFIKMGIPFHVRMDGGSHFRGPFNELLEEFKIPYTPSSPNNPESSGLVECFVGTAKLLLEKTLEAQENFEEALSYLNHLARAEGYLPFELFYCRRP